MKETQHGKQNQDKKRGKGSHVYQLVGDNEAIVADEGLSRCANSLLAIGGEGNVGPARVLTAE